MLGLPWQEGRHGVRNGTITPPSSLFVTADKPGGGCRSVTADEPVQLLPCRGPGAATELPAWVVRLCFPNTPNWEFPSAYDLLLHQATICQSHKESWG